MNWSFPPSVLEDLGLMEHKPMPCCFLFQFQKSSWATPTRGKLHYFSRCQHAVLLGGVHTCEAGSLYAATAGSTANPSEICCSPAPALCLALPVPHQHGKGVLGASVPDPGVPHFNQLCWWQAATSSPGDLHLGSPSPGHPRDGNCCHTRVWLVRKEVCFICRTDDFFKEEKKIMKCASIQLRLNFVNLVVNITKYK